MAVVSGCVNGCKLLGTVVDFSVDRVTLNIVAKLEQEKKEEKGTGKADGTPSDTFVIRNTMMPPRCPRKPEI